MSGIGKADFSFRSLNILSGVKRTGKFMMGWTPPRDGLDVTVEVLDTT